MNSSTEEKMVLGPEAFECGIRKKLLHAGKTPIDYVDGTKVFFHFKTILSRKQTVLDDSKKMDKDKPMELIIGKKFKLEIWERAIKTMWLNEVASFSVVKEVHKRFKLLFDYPIVSKQLRDFYKYRPDMGDKDCKHDHSKTETRHHCCGFNLIEHGVGHSDLDALLKTPHDLEFIFEIIRVEQPGQYVKDLWSLSDEERVKIIPRLKEEGNEFFKCKKFKEASEKYQDALSLLEQMMLREKPNDTEWNELNEKKMPILLNFSLCKFNMGEFYECIEHTNTILVAQSDNLKALFRRAKAYAAIYDFANARKDFKKCIELDSSLTNEVNAQLDFLKKQEEKFFKEEKEKYRGKLFG